jgi:hypothetical protein
VIVMRTLTLIAIALALAGCASLRPAKDPTPTSIWRAGVGNIFIERDVYPPPVSAPVVVVRPVQHKTKSKWRSFWRGVFHGGN